MREACVFVRPGITGPATLKYRDEEALLAEQNDPQKYLERGEGKGERVKGKGSREEGRRQKRLGCVRR